MAGVGKTALAVQAAQAASPAYPEGICPVSLDLVRLQCPDLLRTRFSEKGRTKLSH
jgi:hypothetical protein